MILANDHYENLLRVDHKIEFSRPPQLSEGTKEKTKMQRQTYEKEYYKQVRFHWTGKILKNMDIVPFNINSESSFERN